MSSIKANIFTNYVSQFYVAGIGILMVPFYIRYMGAEAYGLIGFYTLLQSWFMLLDMGLTPTMQRETARFHGGSIDAISFRRVVRALEGLFLGVSIIGGGVLFFSSGYIAYSWLKASSLPYSEVHAAIGTMAFIIAFRWMGGLYRGAIVGSEKLAWLGGFNAFLATIKSLGVVPLLLFVGVAPRIFFGYQLVIALIELIGLMLYAYRLLPDIPKGAVLSWDIRHIRPLLRFSLTLAFTSSVWILTTQMDKLVLSKILPLADYGYFTLAVLVASVVIMISSPVGSAIMPRLSKCDAAGDSSGLILVYKNATQLVSVVAGSAAITLVFCAERVLYVWTGDHELARQAAPVLQAYALGNGVLAVGAFPYYLQYAKGDLRVHFIWNIGSLIVLVPSVIWVAERYGGVGAGYVWLVMNLLGVLTLPPLIHHKFYPGLNRKWFSDDVLVIFASGACAGLVVTLLLATGADRWLQLIEVLAVGIAVLSASSLASAEIRKRLNKLRVFLLQRATA
ncbi:oligosaccharide flippase family protein [Pelodictyon luteolum]|uniref:O-antigen transporter-like protein n=1 Tax=Chlorobium luteolum (strain DSM 273 / BCRC 81028 / 2530) TaxID=319225 RepID=Q3B4U1_CHLL3|nr:oligosaccharide flippase family protein [Pelodictyon luteolum]ABB23640.1 O-antigen transporter-like protein [Pelodictyon luteolum DSM 273]